MAIETLRTTVELTPHQKLKAFGALVGATALFAAGCGESKEKNPAQEINNVSAVEPESGDAGLVAETSTLEERAQAYCEEQKEIGAEGHVILEATTHYTDPATGEEITVSC